MANYYNLYKRAIIDELVSYTKHIYPGQLLTFSYGEKSQQRIVMSIGEWDNKLHCLKLNEVNPKTLAKLFRFVLSSDLIERYETGVAYGIYDETLRLNEYQLPLKYPKMNRDATAQYFYRNVVQPSALLKSGQVYRTYNKSEIKKLRVLVPDLQKLGFIDNRIKLLAITEQERLDFLKEGREIDDYSKRPKFGKQDDQFD